MNKSGLSRRNTIHLPQFTIGEDASDTFGDEMLPLGNTAAVIYGEKVWATLKEVVVPALKRVEARMAYGMSYGQDAIFKNVEHVTKNLQVREADYLLAVGDGRCIDTAKLMADRLGKPVFTIPGIVSNCVPVARTSTMYHEDGSFREVLRLKMVPVHCFINPRIILAALVRYLWVGTGDAMAKNVGFEWSAEARERPSYGSELGIMTGRLCFTPIIRDAGQVLHDAAKGQNSNSLEQTILDIVIPPGITFVTMAPEYNSGAAHVLFYGLTNHRHIERCHLHEEVVSYGTLINLVLGVIYGGGKKRLKAAYEFNRSLGLPVYLANPELDASGTLEDVLEVTMKGQELLHTPYSVNREATHQVILNLGGYSPGV